MQPMDTKWMVGARTDPGPPGSDVGCASTWPHGGMSDGDLIIKD